MSSPSSRIQFTMERQDGRLPMLTVEDGRDPAQWADQHREALRAAVDEHGAVMVRGLGLRDATEVATVFQRLVPDGLMPDREAFAARHQHSEGVYSSLKWPANQPMCMHHELSYALEFPGLLLFACLEAPSAGGVTGVADAHTVLEALPEDLVRRFEDEGWLLARSYNEDVGASYEEAFGATDRAAVEGYCRSHAIEFEWQPDGELRTRQRRPAVVRHPVTGQRCWFNQVAFLNEWTIAPEIREYLVDVYGPDGLPFNTRYGNGDPIGEDVIALVNEVYEAHTLRTPWEAGDLMVVDNVRMAHSREAYEGPREILVGMAEPRRVFDLVTHAQEDVR
jgi:alpha-ketoglutarate-dependent taurine dioxygenase